MLSEAFAVASPAAFNFGFQVLFDGFFIRGYGHYAEAKILHPIVAEFCAVRIRMPAVFANVVAVGGEVESVFGQVIPL